MSARTHSAKSDGAKFIAAILAPVAAGEVETKEFRRALLEDMKREWSLAKMLVDATNYERLAEGMRDMMAYARTGAQSASAYDRFDWSDTPHWKACDALMRIPSPTIGALRWKQGAHKFGGGHPDWEEAIAADVGRLEPGACKKEGR